MQLQCGARQGSTVKAVATLERFCPNVSMAPVKAIVGMVAGVIPKKENDPTPMGRLDEFRHPGRALLNSPWGRLRPKTSQRILKG